MGRARLNSKVKKMVFNNSTKEAYPGDLSKTQHRLDFEGREIHFSHYGNRDASMGWNIDHINRDTDDRALANLRAVHFKTHEELNLKFNKSHKN